MKDITLKYRELISASNAFRAIGVNDKVKLGSKLERRVHRAMRRIKTYLDEYEVGEKAINKEYTEILEGVSLEKMNSTEREAFRKRSQAITELQDEVITIEGAPTFTDEELIERGCRSTWVFDLGPFVEWEDEE